MDLMILWNCLTFYTILTYPSSLTVLTLEEIFSSNQQDLFQTFLQNYDQNENKKLFSETNHEGVRFGLL